MSIFTVLLCFLLAHLYVNFSFNLFEWSWFSSFFIVVELRFFLLLFLSLQRTLVIVFFPSHFYSFNRDSLRIETIFLCMKTDVLCGVWVCVYVKRVCRWQVRRNRIIKIKNRFQISLFCIKEFERNMIHEQGWKKRWQMEWSTLVIVCVRPC